MNDELCESHIATDVPQPTIDAIFHKQRHITYWKRNLRTYLPHYYTSNDCHRLLLVFFILSALDLLGILNESTTAEERAGWADWIYTCQHSEGGFRGSPALDLRERRSQENADWDPANIPGTYFALSALLLLRDDLTRVKRKGCLQWLNKMQRPDGSFGETVTANGEIHGGMDTRFAYTATGIRWILRGRREGEVDGVPDIDGVALTKCIAMSETYEGGISEMPFHEPHGGYTYCALATLSFLGRLSSTTAGGQVQNEIDGIDNRVTAPSDPELTTQWLLSRQTTILDEDEADDEADRPATDPLPPQDTSSVGWNGRCNKIADTCYCWWGAAALDLLGRIQLCDQQGSTEFLLAHTQHKIAGGFGKHGGSPPDLYHSYLGLAVLSVFRHPDVKTIHPAACFSWDTVDFLDRLDWRKEIWNKPEASLFDKR